MYFLYNFVLRDFSQILFTKLLDIRELDVHKNKQ